MEFESSTEHRTWILILRCGYLMIFVEEVLLSIYRTNSQQISVIFLGVQHCQDPQRLMSILDMDQNGRIS